MKRLMVAIIAMASLSSSTFGQTSSSGKINGHEFVDLGLSVKWATCNVGAKTPSDYGLYFSWGETAPKETFYDWEHYRFRTTGDSYDNVTFNKYNSAEDRGIVDNKTRLDPADDAAFVNWGGTWRLPTLKEWNELRQKCTWTWTTQGGKNGYVVTGPNGNSIFLPAAGERGEYTSVFYGGSRGYYWSSTMARHSFQAWNYQFYSSNVGADEGYRSSGWSVRPVSDGTRPEAEMAVVAEATETPRIAQVDLSKIHDKSVNFPTGVVITEVAPDNSQDGSTNTQTRFVKVQVPESSTSSGSTSSVSSDSGFVNGHKYVDLGLSVKWATCNIGADTPFEPGSLFAWGEVFSLYGDRPGGWNNYRFFVGFTNNGGIAFSKYDPSIDNLTNLVYMDDAAFKRWGGTWRIPTKKEWDELLTRCTWTYYRGKNYRSISFFKVTSTINGNSIYFTLTGYRDPNIIDFYSGYYWTSSLNVNSPKCAYSVFLDSKIQESRRNGLRRFGYAIRPVTK